MSWAAPSGPPSIILAVIKDAFDFVLVSPPPWGPGDGPDCNFPKEIGCLGPIPARIRGETFCYVYFGFKHSWVIGLRH